MSSFIIGSVSRITSFRNFAQIWVLIFRISFTVSVLNSVCVNLNASIKISSKPNSEFNFLIFLDYERFCQKMSVIICIFGFINVENFICIILKLVIKWNFILHRKTVTIFWIKYSESFENENVLCNKYQAISRRSIIWPITTWRLIDIPSIETISVVH